MSTFYYICFLPNLITAQQNVIALCALLQSSSPEEKRVLYHELRFEPTPLPPSLPLDKPRLSIFLEMLEIQGRINPQSLPLGDHEIL